MEVRLYDVNTVDDYYSLPEGSHVELIDGYFYNMSAPGTRHQALVVELSTIINTYIKSKKGSGSIYI